MCKKLILLTFFIVVLGLALSVPAGAEQFLVEHFNYANGMDLNGQGAGQGTWITAGTNYMVLNDDGLGDDGTSSLQYPGLTDSQGGRLAQGLTADGDCRYILSTPVVGEGNALYLSVLLKPTVIATAYFIYFVTDGSVQHQLGRLRGQNSGGQQELGVSLRGSSFAGWSGKTVALGETALVVIKLTMVPGPDNDTMELWVNPTVGTPEPPADARSLVDAGNDVNPDSGVQGFRFRIHNNSGEKEVDEIRFGTTWDDVVGSVGGAEAASAPSPGDEMTDVPRDVVLSWTPGEYADKHNVYFGTSFDDVNDATTASEAYLGLQSETTYALGRLEFGQSCYWRVDEVNAPPDNTIFKGDVWSFTVEPIGYAVAGTSITATASSSNALNEGPENTINGSGLDPDVHRDDLHSAVNTDMWLSSTTGPQPTWIQYELDRVYKLHEMLVWNHNSSLELAIGFGVKEATIEYSVDGASWTTLGTHEFARALGAAGYAADTTVDLSGVVAKYVKITANSNWGGFMPQYGLSEVRLFYVPVKAREPNPASGSKDMDVDNVTLSWRAGREAASHEVQLSDSNQAVIDGTALVVSVSEASYDTGELQLNQNYYWKVNEVNDAETPTTWEGDVLNFTTREFLVVDDFEDYNNFSPDRVFQIWVDGIGFTEPAPGNPGNGSGAALGHDIWSPSSPYYNGSIMETAIVHGGAQSAPLYYDNTIAPFASEIVRTFDVPQDWTKHGIKALTLYFYGDPNNVAQQMYVKFNGSKVVYGGDVNALKQGMWKRWSINLSSFGVNLSNVTELTIGLERIGAVGGKGVVFFDDIGLYSVVPEPLEEIFFEAEAADILGASWRVTDDTTAMGGKYIGSEDGDGNDNDTAPGAEWVALYNFTAPAAGVYTVVLRAQDAGDDSFWVRIPGATSQTHEDPDQPGTGWVADDIDSPEGVWQWAKIESNDHDGAAVSWTLPAGANTLEIAKREDGVYLDAILITSEAGLD